jgi:hypothetical protein
VKNFSKYKILLAVIVLLGGIVRLYNYDWGEGNFFHPDERNIAISVSKLNFEAGDYNPDFFAYGSLPIYILYVISKGNFETTLIAGRIISGLLSTISLVLIYQLSQSLLSSIFSHKKNSPRIERRVEYLSLLTTYICAFSPGLIQFAHFTTFETFLTFEYLLFAILVINLMKEPSKKNYFLVSLVTGFAIGTKIVSLFLLAIFFLVHFFVVLKQRTAETNKLNFVTRFPFRFFSGKFILSLLISGLAFVVTNPFMILDNNAFMGSLDYESAVARGTLSVFYSEQFIQTIPFVYQFLYVFPSIMSWPFTIIGFLGFLYMIIYGIKFSLVFIFRNKYAQKLPLISVTLIALGYSVFHFYLYVKWSRYVVPLIPFLIMFSVLTLANLSFKYKGLLRITLLSSLIVFSAFSIMQGLNFFSIYLKPDPRIEAAKWLREDSKEGDTFAGEVYDMGMTAFNAEVGSSNITELNYYQIDDGYTDEQEMDLIDQVLRESEYIIIPAERIYPTRYRLKEKFPNGYEHYRKLFAGELGYTKVAEFTRTTLLEDLFQIRFYNGGYFSALNYDETFRVFDQPTITIFKKDQ